jgi:hypothetical protein
VVVALPEVQGLVVQILSLAQLHLQAVVVVLQAVIVFKVELAVQVVVQQVLSVVVALHQAVQELQIKAITEALPLNMQAQEAVVQVL